MLINAGVSVFHSETIAMGILIIAGLHDMIKEDNIRSVMETLSSHYQDEFTEQMNKAVKEGKLDKLMENLQDNVSSYLD